MGEMASYYAEQGLYDAIPPPKRKRRPPKNVWRTKDGRRIPIAQLENGHLVNIIKMLARKADQFATNFELAMTVVALRELHGEMARESVLSGIEHECDRPALHVMFDNHPTFKLLIKEVQRRKLSKSLKAEVQPILEQLE